MRRDYKSEQLGIPYGTAVHQLRKRMLFHLARQLGMTVCFHCGKEITELTEFSLEHKIPWLHNDVSLFWSVENIAFSHLKCNTDAGGKKSRYRLGHSPSSETRAKISESLKQRNR